MNTMVGEVLREVLMGLLITELDVKRSRIRRRSPRMKRVPRQSGFMLWCHAQTIRKRERERERETNRKTPSQQSTKNKEKIG